MEQNCSFLCFLTILCSKHAVSCDATEKFFHRDGVISPSRRRKKFTAETNLIMRFNTSQCYRTTERRSQWAVEPHHHYSWSLKLWPQVTNFGLSDFRTLGLFDVFEVFEGFRRLRNNKMLNYLIVIYNIYIIYNYSILLCKLKIAKSPKVLSSFRPFLHNFVSH